MRHFCVARFLQGPGGNASEHVHRVNASSAMGERCLMVTDQSKAQVAKRLLRLTQNLMFQLRGPVRAAILFAPCIFCYPLIDFAVRITQN